jgi:outer membrane lipase/esterase
LALSSSPLGTALGFTPRPTAPFYRPGQFTNGPTSTGGTAGLTATVFTQGHWVNVLADGLGRARPAAAGLAADVAPLGTNYAWGGALAGGPGDLIPNAPAQVGAYLSTATPGSIAPGTIYTFWFGGNDLINAAQAPGATPASIAAAGQAALTASTASINALLTGTSGAAGRQVLWWDMAPVDLTPTGLALAAPLRQALQQATLDFRAGQLIAAGQLAAQHNVTLATPSARALFDAVLASPATFGVSNTNDPILLDTAFTQPGPFAPTLNVPLTTNPDTYAFWDELHPTARMHALIGQVAIAAIPTPGTVMILAPLTMLSVRRRRAAA